jgi:hypothetical protein
MSARERRIEQEIVVDAYTSDERAIGWHCYLDDKLGFPFKAKCIAAREISPLKKGEVVEVLGMAPADDCMREMFVRWRRSQSSSRKRSRPRPQPGSHQRRRRAAARCRSGAALRTCVRRAAALAFRASRCEGDAPAPRWT